MLADAHDPLSRSAGSFFLNPRLSPAERARAEERARACGALAERDSLPGFVEADGRLKVPAAWLIERAGFPRGCRRGAVGLSAHHALAIVNYGAARAQDVVALAREIRDGVRTRFGIVLTPEPVLVGLSIE
jgi:UDP-N-acetylmuramate dehydrogenase